MLVEGSVSTTVFNAYCEIEQISRSCGTRVIWLPPYLPNFTPIEVMWSKVKTYLRQVKARTQEELEEVVAAALETIIADDCLNWFWHCGYEVARNRKLLQCSSFPKASSSQIIFS